MGTIWIKEFTGGLDTRRMAETTAGGVLIVGTDGHINRGGEFEKRPAFVRQYELPEDATVGLAAGKNGLFVFGSGAPPTLPAGVSYQRLQHPDGATELVSVPSYDLYAGKIYAVGEFEDGSRYHFYDGVRVPAWFDGRARASFRVTGGGSIPATAAVGSFEVTGGTSGMGNEITNIAIDGVSIISAPVSHTGNNGTTAAAVASAITSSTSSPEYTATASGQTVTITAAVTGPAANGKTIVITNGGDVTTGNIQNMAGGANIAFATLAALTVDGVSILNAPVQWTSTNTETAELIATSINTAVSSPDYTATAVGETVNIVAVDAGAAANGRIVGFTLQNGFTVDPTGVVELADGSDPVPAAAASGSFVITGGTSGAANRINTITIAGVEIMGGAVTHTGSNGTTATAVANAINAFVSTPNYTATANAATATVTITASTTGTAVNGASIVIGLGGNVTVGSVQAMAGGAAAEATFVPGTFVKTVGSRMHSVSGANEHFSGIQEPTRWTTDTTGAGFIDMSTQASGSEELTALAKYQQFLAVFAERTIQIWYFDSDPQLHSQKQVLNNTGTASPRSVTQFGDNDLFYLDESGLRSLRARDASNAAATTDIGVPVDTLIVELLNTLTPDERKKVVGLINPRDGRFWLIMKSKIFVFSFFGGAKISAWTTYTPSTYAEDVLTSFDIDDAVVFRRRVYLRAGDDIYVFGGEGAELTYDDTEAEAWLPYLDANAPTREKSLTGIDCAVQGQWVVSVGMKPTDQTVVDEIGIVTRTTYGEQRVSAEGASTHFGLRFRSRGPGEAKLGSAVIHYESSVDED